MILALRSIHRGKRESWKSRPIWLILTGCVLAGLSGCDEEPRQVLGKPGAAFKQYGNSGPIVGQRTQSVVNAAPELEKGNARIASTKIVAKNPITLAGNAYVTSIGPYFP